MKEFAQDEIIIPSGPYAGEFFSVERNPFTAVWFDLVDSGKWNRCFATGPNQSSKTLCCSVTPTLYHLFEQNENVIYGIPDLNMIADKWEVDLLPVIRKSRYAKFLPKKGAGSRGGSKNMTIRFEHGPILRFMASGGKDKARAGFTARVLVVTELDAFDDRSEKSKEGDKFSQLTRRLLAYGERSIVYGENTVSIEQGRTWQEYQNGTKTELYKPCPRCAAWVRPEREHLLGWQEAETEMDARKSLIHCPKCGEPWTETERYDACMKTVAVMRGQTIDEDGNISGDLPETNTLSFRWDATDNFIISLADAAAMEWASINGANKKDPILAEIEIRQSIWAIPPESDIVEANELTAGMLLRRMSPEVQSKQVPDWSDHVTVGVDVGSRLIYYTVTAWGQGAKSVVIEYGPIEVPSDIMEVEKAVVAGLQDLFKVLSGGYKDDAGETIYPTLVFIDSNYQRESVVAFCEQMFALQKKWTKDVDPSVPEMLRVDNRVFWPISGFGETTDARQIFYAPRSVGPAVVKVGEHSYIGTIPIADVSRSVVHIDVDWWKDWVRSRLTCSIDSDDSMSFFFTSDRYGHLRIAKHLLAEVPTTIFVKGRGNVRKWDKKHRNNHLFDALGYAANAAWWAGTRLGLVEKESQPEPTTIPASRQAKSKPQEAPKKSWIPKRP